LKEFGWSRADTALIFSLNILVYGATAPIAGALVDRFGPRKAMPAGALLLTAAAGLSALGNSIWHFLIFYGVLMAIGACIAGWIPHSAMAARWFVKRRGLALSAIAAGFGLSLLMAPVVQYLISTLGWRWAFAVMGSCVFAIVLPLEAIIPRRQPEDMGLQPDGASASNTSAMRAASVSAEALVVDKKWAATDWTLRKAMKTRRFWLQFMAGFCLWGMAQTLILAHQVAFIVDIGYSTMFGALIFSLYGVFSITGNLLGSISDWIGREMTVTLGVTSAVLGMLMLLLANFIQQPVLLYLYAVLFGLGVGINSPTIVAIAADIFPGRHFGAIYGMISTAFGIGGAISPWLGGRIFDATGSYAWAFAITAVSASLACPLMWLASPRKVRLVPGRVKKAAAPKGS
ncbi:MAG: MFS transporter, partial [Dehalococcoidia bacterium]|nr:MFS transporter [Dehalococcoidia bacterium]